MSDRHRYKRMRSWILLVENAGSPWQTVAGKRYLQEFTLDVTKPLESSSQALRFELDSRHSMHWYPEHNMAIIMNGNSPMLELQPC